MRSASRSRTALVILCVLLIGPGSVTIGQETVPVRLDAGPLKLEIYISRTAHLFHVVDQLSEWSEFSHRQYGRYFSRLDSGYSSRDRELLAKHASIRAVHGWSAGLEQTFYTPADLESALRLGVQKGYLTQSEADSEREIFMHFSSRVSRLMQQESPTLDRFIQRLTEQLGALRQFAEKTSRFVHGAQLTLPVYLMANPDARRSGGGYTGNRLTVEIPRSYDAYPVFLHEVLHAFVETSHAEVEQAAAGVVGLDHMTLNEGIAYALSPGLFHPDSATSARLGDTTWRADPLVEKVRADIQAQKPLSEPYTRFNRLGLALRPLLKQAIDSDTGTITSFLPTAVNAWYAVQELDKALHPTTKVPKK